MRMDATYEKLQHNISKKYSCLPKQTRDMLCKYNSGFLIENTFSYRKHITQLTGLYNVWQHYSRDMGQMVYNCKRAENGWGA